MDASLFKRIYPLEYYKKFLVQNVRPSDGRSLIDQFFTSFNIEKNLQKFLFSKRLKLGEQKISFDQKTIIMVRPTKLSQKNSISTADGSSFIKLGKTLVCCGVTAELGPVSDKKILVQDNLHVDKQLGPLRIESFSWLSNQSSSKESVTQNINNNNGNNNNDLNQHNQKSNSNQSQQPWVSTEQKKQTSFCGNPSGRIVINTDLGPISNSKFKKAKPSDQAQDLTHFLNQLIDSQGMISLKNVDLEPTFFEREDPQENSHQISLPHEQLGWYFFVDLYCLNYDGNLVDAFILALVSALKNLQLPKIEYIAKSDEIVRLEEKAEGYPVCFNYHPIPLSFCSVAGFLLADPNNEEEDISDFAFFVIVTEKHQVLQISKKGGSGLKLDKVRAAIERTKLRVPEVMALWN